MLLLSEDSHRSSIRLNGLKPGRSLNFPVNDELPDLLALRLHLKVDLFEF